MAGGQTELLFELQMDLDQEAAQRVGATSRGTRLIGYIKGGTFEGPKLKGDVLPGGGDWLLIRPDGVREPDCGPRRSSRPQRRSTAGSTRS